MKFRIKFINIFGCSLLFTMLGILGCSEVIEENLEDEKVTLLNPTDNLTTTFATQTFNWQEVEGTDRYQMQIVNGSFQQINYYVLDSNLISTRFVFNLNPGIYQWRVRAINSVSETPFVTRSITIDSTTDLTGQSVILSFPANNSFINNSNPSYSWQELYNADQYIFQLRKINENGPLVYTDTVSTSDLSASLNLQEGKFSWGVKAINSTSSTSFSYFNFTIDLTPPTAPGITTTDSTQQSPVLLRWNRTANDVETDSFYLYSNANLTNIIHDVEANESFSDSLAQGTYFWRVKSIDKAGNIGSFSTTKKIEVTP